MTRASREARSLGYVYETIALKHRYLRRAAAWEDHIARCKAATLSAVHGSGANKTMVILGSGPLLEIPMEELLELFENIVLLDFVHPRDVRARWGRHSRVQLVDQDLLGIAPALLTWKTGPLPKAAPPDLSQFNADFILSANCLSQLALKPRQFLENAVAAPDLDHYCELLSAAHLRSIQSAGCAHLIIADFESRVIEADGQISERTEPFFDRRTLKLLDSWAWKLAPAGELYKHRAVEMTAGAFTIL